MSHRAQGFTFIELIIVVAIMGILATLAFPAIQDYALRKQVREGMALADVVKPFVAGARRGRQLPMSNAEAGAPLPEKIAGVYISSVTINEGAITLVYGNSAGAGLMGKKLTLRPALMVDTPITPIAWVCHDVAPPKGMELIGQNQTDIPPKWLPVECRGGTGKKL